MRIRNILFGAAAVAALSACGSNEAENSEPTITETAGMENAVPANPDNAMMPTTPQGFVDTMAASDMFEIESSQIAQTMATRPEVKEFAQMMVAEHTKSTSALKSAAGQAQPALTVTPSMTEEQQQAIAELRRTTTDFDSNYMQKQIEAHQNTLSMLQSYASTGEVQPLRDFASQTAAVVSGHLQQARELNQSQ